MLNILVLSQDAERFRGALMLALTHCALGGAARLFLQLDAVALIGSGATAPRDAAHAAAGLPRLATLIDEALDAGVAIIACQSGLHIAGMDAALLDRRVETGGLAGFMAAADGPITVV